MKSAYQILAENTRAEFEEKRSRFMCYLFSINNKTEINANIELVKLQSKDASHYCTAYIIGDTRQPLTQGFDDDGEPSGTAGKPMLNILTQREAGNCMAVVARYFGGVKLGAGGLVRAYGAAVSLALDSAKFTTCFPQSRFSLAFPFQHESSVRHIIGLHSGKIESIEYSDMVMLTLSLNTQDQQKVAAALTEVTSGDIKIGLTG